ncbi:hypothetical protein DFS34DRAFT_614856 [Phlyctochytrium arcticum]|nr:hypothetical protein DFS34DRAFT_614856 [Phlyctochytrium arcticum]
MSINWRAASTRGGLCHTALTSVGKSTQIPTGRQLAAIHSRPTYLPTPPSTQILACTGRYRSQSTHTPSASSEFPPPIRKNLVSLLKDYSQLSFDHRQKRGVASRFNFDTYKLVRQLERQGFTRGQAVAIMRTINALLVDSTLAVRSGILSKTDLENQTYLYKAHLQELRNELQLLRQNDSAQLKADTEQILREIESLNGKFAEMIGSLKTDVSMDLNNHKTDGREVGTDTDLRIQEIHHKLIVRISDLKTKIETMKVETTRIIVWMALGTFAILMSIDWITPVIFGTGKKPPPAEQAPNPIISAFPHPLRSSQPPPQPAQPAPPPLPPVMATSGSQTDDAGNVLSF